MNSLFRSSLMVLFFAGLYVFNSCGEPEEPMEPEVFIAQDFDIVGKWFYRYVSGEGVIFGVPQSDEDKDPSGFVEFYDDNHGFSDFELTLLDEELGKMENIQWEWIDSQTLDVEESDGQHQTWNILYADNDSINAKWDIDILGNTATINAIFTK